MNTILDLLRDQARREPDSPAIYTRLTPTTTNWISLTWKEVWDRVIALSIGFKARGLESGDRLAIIAPNGLEWELADGSVPKVIAGSSVVLTSVASTGKKTAFGPGIGGVSVFNIEECRFLPVELVGVASSGKKGSLTTSTVVVSRLTNGR